jgi:site-specific DNA recombinase
MNQEGKPARVDRVALYARVSSEAQAQEATIDSQMSLLRERIEGDGCKVEPAMCFVDDGVSGTTLVRPGLERLRDQAAAGAVDRLYVLAPDRLARRHAHQMVLVDELRACGVEMMFVNRPLGTTPEDQLLLQVQSVIAEYERAKILERTRRGRLHAARAGRISTLSHAPYGYRYIDKYTGGGAAAYEVVEDEARVVQQVFDWVGRDGCSLREVARRLEKMGIRTGHGLSRWNPATIGGMIKNSAYRGQAAYGKSRLVERRRLRPGRGHPEVPKTPLVQQRQPASEQILIPVPALVDADLFAAAQKRVAENRRALRERLTGASHFLQGLAVCRLCGYAICGQGGTKNRFYYRCLGRDGYRFCGRRICNNRPQRTEDLDTAVWKDVCQLLSEPDRLREEFERRQQSSVSDHPAQSERLRTAMSKTKQSIGRLIDVYTAGLVETSEFEPRIQRLKERLAKLDAERHQLAQEIREHDELRLVYSRFEDFADQINQSLTQADWKQRRELLRALVKRVEVDNETLRIVYKVPPRPFVNGPQRGRLQHCWRRQRNATYPRRRGRTPLRQLARPTLRICSFSRGIRPLRQFQLAGGGGRVMRKCLTSACFWPSTNSSPWRKGVGPN